MAKSKSGGTRSYLRGKIGADVYSVGKDGKGNKQQVVRSLAEVVSNPQTQAQMRGRMIMSTVMQAVAGLSQIVDHSFDGVPTGQPSISEFIRRNYALVKADVAAHPSTGNTFGLNKYQEKGIKQGLYEISDGKASIPSGIDVNGNNGIVIFISGDKNTVGYVRSLFGGGEDYLTFCYIDAGKGFKFVRIHFSTELADNTVINGDNADKLFTFEGNDTAKVTFEDGQLNVSVGNYMYGKAPSAAIISVKENGTWIHNKAVLAGVSSPEFSADIALPTYPVGAARFLNGGEL